MSPDHAGNGSHHVDILSTGDGCRVTPAVVGAKVGDKVEFQNWTAEDVWLFFPGDIPIQTPKKAIGPGKSETFTVSEKKKGPHTYLAYCESSHDCAHAASHPIIIVRD